MNFGSSSRLSSSSDRPPLPTVRCCNFFRVGRISCIDISCDAGVFARALGGNASSTKALTWGEEKTSRWRAGCEIGLLLLGGSKL